MAAVIQFKEVQCLDLNEEVKCLGLDKEVQCLGLDKEVKCPGLDKEVQCLGLDKEVQCLGLDKEIQCLGSDFSAIFDSYVLCFLVKRDTFISESKTGKIHKMSGERIEKYIILFF